MAEHDDVRKSVSAAYARAVTSGGGCCGGGAAALAPKGVTAKLAGYAASELVALPKAAVENAFGCGTPVAMSEIAEGDVVLDLGSGAGIDLLLAAKRVGPRGRVIGVDMTDAMIAEARANIAASGLSHVEVRKGIIEDLPVDSASVDWVISNCVINLSPEKPRAFAEVSRVLKPGGRMLVSDIVAGALPEEVRRDPALYASCIAGAIAEDDYVAGLRAAGLTDVAVRDRLVYDDEQVAMLLSSEIDGGCCGVGCGPNAPELAKSLRGKLASVRVFARKPPK
jgi:SAM-dependent methyltransferase